MSPLWSIAALPIQRESAEGENVPCWKMLQAPVVFRSSYQRTPAWPETLTVWSTTIASRLPRFRYARRYIGRSASASSQYVYPSGSSIQSMFVSNEAVVSAVSSVNVELAGDVQLGWKPQIFSWS